MMQNYHQNYHHQGNDNNGILNINTTYDSFIDSDDEDVRLAIEIASCFTPISKPNNRASPTFSFHNINVNNSNTNTTNTTTNNNNESNVKLFAVNDNDNDNDNDMIEQNIGNSNNASSSSSSSSSNTAFPDTPPPSNDTAATTIVTATTTASMSLPRTNSTTKTSKNIKVPPRCIGDIKKVSEQVNKLDDNITRKLYHLLYGSKSNKVIDVKANILNFECFSGDWTRDSVIDRIFTNKKFTVAILEMFIDIFGLDKIGDRKKLAEIIIDYLMNFRDYIETESIDKPITKRNYLPNHYSLYYQEERKRLINLNPLLSFNEITTTVAAQWNSLNSQEKELWKVKAAAIKKEATSTVVIKKRKADDTNHREKYNRIGKKRKGDRPVQAPSSYAVFCKENTQKILATNTKLNFSEISKGNAEAWKALSDAEKIVFKQKSDTIKEMLFKVNSSNKNFINVKTATATATATKINSATKATAIINETNSNTAINTSTVTIEFNRANTNTTTTTTMTRPNTNIETNSTSRSTSSKSSTSSNNNNDTTTITNTEPIATVISKKLVYDDILISPVNGKRRHGSSSSSNISSDGNDDDINDINIKDNIYNNNDDEYSIGFCSDIDNKNHDNDDDNNFDQFIFVHDSNNYNDDYDTNESESADY